jgi:hypothetical protein
MSTYMWKTGPSEFRIQTDEMNIDRKLARRQKPKLVAYGVNTYIRVYELSNIRPQNARRTLSHLLGQEIKKNPVTGEYELKMHSYMYVK